MRMNPPNNGEHVKIIYITASLPHGSDEAFVIPEIEQLVRLGHEVLVIPRSPRGKIIHGHELVELARREGLCSGRVLKVAVAATLAAPGRTAAAVRSLVPGRSLRMAAKNLAIVPKALWLADVATRWKADHIHCHWAGTTATMAMLASRLSGIPWSLTAHRWDIVENNLLAAKARSASFVRFISEDGLRMAQGIGIAFADKVRVLHMGVPVSTRIQRRSGLNRVVLCPARLVEVKGHSFLLKAWQILQRKGLDAELWLAGHGELRPQLERLSDTLGLASSVKFLGAIAHSELLKMYEEAAVTVVVLASVDLGNGLHEGVPVALIEAMSYGIPVIATPTGGTAELVRPGTGLLVPPADPAALADAIDNLLMDAGLREQLGEAGRQSVLEDWDIAGVATQLVREFETARKIASPELEYA
jgi:glycosyltransferase involved in cell wall biosynthesis